MFFQSTTPEQTQKRRRFWQKTRRRLGWTLAVLFVAHSGLNIYASVLLNRELAAIREKGEPLQFAEMAPPAVPDAQNAALLYKQAADSLRFTSEEKFVFLRPPQNLTPQQIQIIGVALLKNQGSLNLTRRAAAMPQCRFPLNYGTDNPLVLLFPHYGDLRDLARLLAAQAIVEAKNGDRVGALRDVRAMWGISRHLSNDPIMVGFLVAQLIDTDANQALAQVLRSVPLTRLQAREFPISLPAENWNRAFHHSLLGERTFILFIFERLRQITITKHDLTLLGSDTTPSDLWISYPLLLLWRPMLKLDEVQSLRLLKQQLDAASIQQLPRYLKATHSIEKTLANTPRYAMMTRILLPSPRRVRKHRVFAEVKTRQREIALALAVYRSAKGQYPRKMKELNSLWGKPLPLDPYSQKPFIYHSDGKSFMLYSVGVNGIDNGGKGILYGDIGSKGWRRGDDDLLWGRAHY
ncbi:MAG: hypothetical protein KY445_11110 [Armatimonadetes bacterium]|nr:hypothetical protein [Armatimonadota bacterium]